MPSQQDVRGIMLPMISAVLAEKGRATKIEDGDTLMGKLQLDSLDLAVLVVRLEQQLGYDPFRTGRPLVNTVGQLIAIYEQGPS